MEGLKERLPLVWWGHTSKEMKGELRAEGMEGAKALRYEGAFIDNHSARPRTCR